MVAWFLVGLLGWLSLRFVVRAVYTVGPAERAVLTSFGRAQRLGTSTTFDDPLLRMQRLDEAARYVWPQVRVVGPGVHGKWPWQRAHKVPVATVIVSIAFDPAVRRAPKHCAPGAMRLTVGGRRRSARPSVASVR